MRRLAPFVIVAASLILVPATKYKNCDALRKKYPNGVAISTDKVGASGATVNKSVYNANRNLDRDKDGIACER